MAREMQQAGLRLRGIEKSYGAARALNGIDLDIPRGDIMAVIGKSGAGKSTLLNIINRLIEPTSGTMTYDGTDVLALRGKVLRAWRRETAMIFQGFNLVPRLSVLQNVMIGRLNTRPLIPSLFGIFTDDDRALAIEALADLEMAEHALKRADELSGGQQQRVAIARALVQKPQIILADEPVASLDPKNSRAVMEALARINAEQGITVICNLHSVALSREYCKRAVAISGGRIEFDGPVNALEEEVLARVYGSVPMSEKEDAA